METTLALNDLAERLKKTDTLMLGIAKRRMELAHQVVQRKKQEAQTPGEVDLIRQKTENDRIAGAVDWARRNNLSPNFAAALEYLLIAESCHEQMIKLQTDRGGEGVSDIPEHEMYAALKANLITLAEHWSLSYDEEYGQDHFGTKAYLEFEREMMLADVAALPHHTLLVDLGCATGKATLTLHEPFEFSIGYDLSPAMVDRATLNAGNVQKNPGFPKVAFRRLDVEHGLDLKANSVSYVVMTLGTASDVRDIEGVIKETMRVLRPGGKFFFSFYNLDALIYRWEFIPWPVGLTAAVNIYKHCLEVHDPYSGTNLPVYARPYSKKEVEGLFKGMTDVRVHSYPTMCAILPSALLEDQPDIQESIVALDRTLVDTNMGAYLIATGAKSV